MRWLVSFPIIPLVSLSWVDELIIAALLMLLASVLVSGSELESASAYQLELVSGLVLVSESVLELALVSESVLVLVLDSE